MVDSGLAPPSRLACITTATKQKDRATVNQEPSKSEMSIRPLPDLPQAITSFGAALQDDALYVYGGHHGQAHHYSRAGQSGDLLRLRLDDPSTWEVVSTGPKLQGLALVAHGGKLHRVGGFTARNTEDEEQDLWSVADFARFDPATMKWQDLPAMPSPRSSFDAAVAGDTLYVVGGWIMQGDEETQWHDGACAVDLSRTPLEWKPLPKPPFERRALSVGTVGGKVYAIGGMQPGGEVTTRTAVYDPKHCAWTEGPKLPGDDMEGFGTASFPVGDRLYASTAMGKVLRLSADGGSWQVAGDLRIGRFFHRMLPIDSKHFAILGGANMKQGRFSAVELFQFQS